MVEIDLNAFEFHKQMHVILNSLLIFFSENKRTPTANYQEDFSSI
jgi:hypothetical protein